MIVIVTVTTTTNVAIIFKTISKVYDSKTCQEWEVTTHITQHNTTQHNTTLHFTTLHNTIQHNTTQHTSKNDYKNNLPYLYLFENWHLNRNENITSAFSLWSHSMRRQPRSNDVRHCVGESVYATSSISLPFAA